MKINLSDYVRKPLWWVLIGVLAMLLVYIAYSKFAVEQRWTDVLTTDKSSCSLPCWNSITPGATEVETAITTLTDIPFIRSGSLRLYSSDSMYAFRFIDGSIGQLRVENNKVVGLILSPPSGVTLSEVFQELGPPSWVIIDIDTGELDGYRAYFLYPERGLIVTAVSMLGAPNHEHTINQALLYPEMDLGFVGIFSPTHESSGVETLKSWLPPTFFSKDVLSAPVEPWSGYGNYRASP